ncbi:MAG: c-type cytochrome [Sideroxyarcus sp.]|nr:c-type cytochrome [Sideroxyarcus sp.]
MRLSEISFFSTRLSMPVSRVLYLFALGLVCATADANAADAGRGSAIYAKSCSVCHGDRGDGNSWAKGQMRPPPRDFTSAQAKAELTRERIIASITHGRPGTAMSAFGSQLGKQDIEAVAEHILTAFVAKPRPPAQTDTTRSADMSASMPNRLSGDAVKGGRFYMGNCATCHGARGDGQGPRAYFINPKPRNFLHPDALRQFNRPALFHAIASGKLGSEMPAWKQVLSEQEIADVAEFVFRQFIRPAVDKSREGKK